eukprot:6200449-Pleurochrysis_carterae.AAC.2
MQTPAQTRAQTRHCRLAHVGHHVHAPWRMSSAARSSPQPHTASRLPPARYMAARPHASAPAHACMLRHHKDQSAAIYARTRTRPIARRTKRQERRPTAVRIGLDGATTCHLPWSTRKHSCKVSVRSTWCWHTMTGRGMSRAQCRNRQQPSEPLHEIATEASAAWYSNRCRHRVQDVAVAKGSPMSRYVSVEQCLRAVRHDA